jgi:hypothetical protein
MRQWKEIQEVSRRMSVQRHRVPCRNSKLQGQQRRLLPFSFLRGEWKRERMF